MAATTRRSIGIFGGTFDPVHPAHISLAQQVQQVLALDEMRLVPCHQPPHRDSPIASDTERLQMLQLACTGTGLLVDDRELHRDGPSYTVDTLESFRQEFGDEVSLVLCIGMDAFANLHTWHRWQDLLPLAHLAVIGRPAAPAPADAMIEWLKHHETTDARMLKSQPGGLIYLTQLDEFPVSSTQIRQALAQGHYPVSTLHPAVLRFIQQRGLYLTR